jgi:hypothetical protein
LPLDAIVLLRGAYDAGLIAGGARARERALDLALRLG